MKLGHASSKRLSSSAKRRGSAVALALVCVTVVTGLAVAFLRISSAASARQMAEVENLRAFYLAEAGLAESFQALRVGRTGQLGSETEPARFGDGLVWVDSVETEDGQVWLESTGLVGTSSVALALVVQPVDIPLGFFSDEELVVDSVLLVDGFNSGERPYDGALLESKELVVYAEDLAERAGKELLLEQLDLNGNNSPHKVAVKGKLSPEEEGDLFDIWPELLSAFEAGLLFPTTPLLPSEEEDETGTETALEKPRGSAPTSGSTAPSGTSSPDGHTLSGGMLGSNGNVVFRPSAGQAAVVFGDVVPGQEGKVKGRKHAAINGETQPRDAAVDLPPVEVPDVTRNGPIRHSELLPLVVSPGISGYEAIEVAPGAELVLRGPGTIVIGELVVEPGATLTLDTRNGNVELFVTGRIDLQAGSSTTTSSDYPEELTVQVAGTAAALDGTPVKLDSTAQFHGTIYAPKAEVHVGGEFEVFGGIVARKLDLGPGAKLHYDNAGFEGTPVPKFISWRIIAIEKSARESNLELFKALRLDPTSIPVLSKSHDLKAVDLKVVYRNLSGVKTTYLGPEEDFDWTVVKKVIRAKRIPRRKKHKNIGVSVEPLSVIEPSPTTSVRAASKTTRELSLATAQAKPSRELLVLRRNRRAEPHDQQAPDSPRT